MKRRLSIKDPNFDLRYLIKNAGLTQAQFAEILGVAPVTARLWCAGSNEPNLTPRQYTQAIVSLKCTPKEFEISTRNARPARLSASRDKKI